MLSALLLALPMQTTGMVDVTAAVGLGPDVVPETVARVVFADINNDFWPDAVINRNRVFLNKPDAASPIGRKFIEVQNTGLSAPQSGTTANFADLDRDGKLDAIVAENVQPDNKDWKDHGMRTRWHKGNGDGSFGEARPLPTPPRPTIATTVGDINQDGWLDIYFGNSYQHDSYAGFPGDLLLSNKDGGWDHVSLPDDDVPFTEDEDLGARPTYGAMMMNLDELRPTIYSLSYGRRWNRLWIQRSNTLWEDIAPQAGLDADSVRNGEYPQWLYERAKTDTRFPTKAEKPFRSNGNSFDSSVADVDNDGRLDLFVSEITHAWAGEASDRSRLLFQKAPMTFETREAFSVDRIKGYDPQRWNQGDLFAELVDMDGDGWTDLLLSAGDYPDQHLRLYLNDKGKGFKEAPDAFPVKHDGSQQISLADIDRDGSPDLIVGQTFNRLNAEQIGGRKPYLKVFANKLSKNKRLNLRFTSAHLPNNPHALGATVTVTLMDGRKLKNQLLGIGGHAGKQHDFEVRFGLGQADTVARVEIRWPTPHEMSQAHHNLRSGTYFIDSGKDPKLLFKH
jgi:hypothetical protein